MKSSAVGFGFVLALVMPRIRGERYHRIDHRHVIRSLVQKPGAFARYRYREELFPSLVFRLFTWLDVGGERTAAILTIIATCIAHDVNPRAYLHLVTKLIVHGWPQSKLRELLPDRMLASHPELDIGDPSSLPGSSPPHALGP